MKKTLSLIIFCINCMFINAQTTSLPCNVDVFCQNTKFQENIQSTVRLTIPGKTGSSSFCTGTIINRDVSQNNVGYYFFTAEHCVDDADFNQPWKFTFNFQNKNCSSSSAPSYLRNAYEHISRVEKVVSTEFNDIAFLRIVSPPPPYFNIYHAGWSTSLGQGLKLPYTIYHHPGGDFKKIAQASTVHGVYTNYTCHTVTKVVDVVYKILIGWWTKTEIRTETLCRHVESSDYRIHRFSLGVTEPGSSGASLLNTDGRIIGINSRGSQKECDKPGNKYYGKLSNAWNSSKTVRDVLRPNAPFVDFTPRLGGRKISCYENLEMDASRSSWVYYPAKDYQPTNHIGLRANHNIVFSGTYRHEFKPESEFSFRAGNNIKLSGDMKIQGNTSFKTGGGCSVARPAPIELKLQKEPMVNFNPNEYLNQQLNTLQNINVYPNPADATLTITSNSSMDGVQYELYNSQNENIKSGTVENNQIVTSDVSNGMYILKLITPTHVYSHRIEIRR